MNLLIVDLVCPKPYDPGVLLERGTGGTEATVVRVAEELAGRHGVNVTVMHSARSAVFTSGNGVRYVPNGANTGAEPTHVIFVRAPQQLPEAQRRFPHARLYLWAHDPFSQSLQAADFEPVRASGATTVLVSEWHRANFLEALNAAGMPGALPACVIHNPIDDALAPDGTPVDIDKLVFFSAPGKGLERTLEFFGRLGDVPALRGTRLYIANPGYAEADAAAGDRLVNLGALPHAAVIGHVRSAFAVLHLNDVWPETFGLVHAEANAVGTPVLAGALGATPEVAGHPGQLVDVRDDAAVTARLLAWRARRPEVRGNPAFRTSQVAEQWMRLLAF